MSDSSIPKWRRYLRFWRANVAADVEDELAFHVDARAQELVDAGVERATARARALHEFGDMDGTRRALRTMDERHVAHEQRVHFAADLSHDVRVAVRGLARSPGVVLVVAITLALGIGVTSAMYSVVDAFLFRPLPGKNTQSLVVLGRIDPMLPLPHDLSYPDYRDYRADTAVFASLAAYTIRILELRTDRGATRLWVDDGTANYFSVLGAAPMLGRTFLPGEDDGELAHPTIVLTYKAWQKHFAGDSSVIGRVVHINDHPVTVIGVMPPAFHGVRPLLDIDGVTCINQVWPTFGKTLEDRGAVLVSVFGRLQPRVSLAAARRAVQVEARQLEQAYPKTNKSSNAVLVREQFARPNIGLTNIMPALAAVFMSLVVLVLLVACANVASVLLARVVVRGRELAIRAAIGASGWRLVRQVLVECAVLALIGGAGAVVVARFATRAIESIQIATDLPMRWGVELNARVVVFTAVATVVAALAAGLAPALAARHGNLIALLKSSVGNSSSRGHQRLRSALVVGQVAVSVVVLVCAGLFARSAANSARMTLGFRADHLMLLSTTLRAQRYDSVAGQARYGELVRRVAALPGVRSAALTRYIPFGFERDNLIVLPVASSVPVPANGFSYFYTVVGGDYFGAMGIPLIAGRTFTDADDERAPRVVVVNDAFARALWPGETAVGKRFRVGDANGPMLEIVGVVRGMQDLFPGETPKPYVFQPMRQQYRAEMTLLVQTAGEPLTVVGPVRTIVAELDPSLPVYDVRTMDDHLRNGQAMLFTRIGRAFSSVFGLLALVLAMVGVYGVVSYTVAARTREIGVRVALGARLPAVLRLVIGQGVKLAWAGVVLGLLLSLGTTGLLRSMLYGVAPRDPIVLSGVLVMLTIIAAVASLVPAWRATRIDPLTAIRAE